jgi:hypothetical protein
MTKYVLFLLLVFALATSAHAPPNCSHPDTNSVDFIYSPIVCALEIIPRSRYPHLISVTGHSGPSTHSADRAAKGWALSGGHSETFHAHAS